MGGNGKRMGMDRMGWGGRSVTVKPRLKEGKGIRKTTTGNDGNGSGRREMGMATTWKEWTTVLSESQRGGVSDGMPSAAPHLSK